jgi:hypothetical protein
MEAYERLLKGQRQEGWQDLVDRARAQIQSELAGRELSRSEEILR